MLDLSQIAINAALSHDWKKAIAANQKILEENHDDINTLNRLAYTFVQVGKLDEAKKIYRKILSLDRYNSIARKNLDKIHSLPKSIKTKSSTQIINSLFFPSLFIEEPGKTKTITLINPAPARILSNQNIGDEVELNPKKHSIEVRSSKVYIGALTDDFAFRLLRFIKSGYEYKAFIKNTTKNSVSIFIKEIKRTKKLKSQPSFFTSSKVQLHRNIKDNKIQDSLEENKEDSIPPQDEFEE